MPLWIIQVAVIAVAIYRFKNALKYMRSKSIFLKEIRAPWIDESRIDLARKLHFAHEISFLVFLVTFPILSTIPFIKPFLIHILMSFLIIWFCLHLWWVYYFSERKNNA